MKQFNPHVRPAGEAVYGRNRIPMLGDIAAHNTAMKAFKKANRKKKVKP